MEDLQTDVMRFMAILAFCLVAVFALVQSIPMRPVQPEPSEDVRPQSLTPASSSEPAETPAAQPPAPARRVAPPPTTAAPEPAARTFTLRFASDAALNRLVTTQQVALYALDDHKVWRLSPKTGGPTFEPATAPARMHVMQPSTVPPHLVLALNRLTPAGEQVTWGVTLPDATTDAITRHLRSPAGGALVIQADGDVRRESADELSKGGQP